MTDTDSQGRRTAEALDALPLHRKVSNGMPGVVRIDTGSGAMIPAGRCMADGRRSIGCHKFLGPAGRAGRLVREAAAGGPGGR